jgi:hypothetical protein
MSMHPKLADGLQRELVAALLLQAVGHSDDPELIQAVTSDKPDFHQIHQLLMNHNEKKHAQLKFGGLTPRPAAPISPGAARARAVQNIFAAHETKQ